MRQLAAVASALAGGSREQEHGEAQGGSEVLVSGRVRLSREWRMGSGEWEDEESLASSPFAIRCSLFTVHCSLFTVHCSLFTANIRTISSGRDAPRTAWRETRQPPED
jgi:hypothetical protein